MSSPARPFPGMVLLAVLGASCGGDDPRPQHGPKLPPLQLRPLFAELNTLAAQHTPPAEGEQQELRELGDIALQLVAADPRTASRAERGLLEHAHAWWVLEPALAHEQVAVRRRAAWLCGQSAQTVLQLPLLLRLKYELDAETVVWVADALQRLGNDTGLAWLDAAIGSEATAQQAGQLAIEALRARGVPLSAEPTWAHIQQHLRERVAAWRTTGTPSLPEVQRPEQEQLEARLATQLATTQSTLLRPIDDARFVLTRAGRLPLPLLQRALGASEPYLRTMALQVLAEIGAAAAPAGSAVMPLLADPLTSAYAVRALGELGAADAVPYLRPMLGDRDVDLRNEATQALGLLRDQASATALRERLRDTSEALDVRVGAAFALRCLGDDAEAEAFLAEREAKKDYHEPTLLRLRERLTALHR